MTDRKEYYKKYNANHREQKKQWRTDNQEHIKEYNAERYQQKKDEINIQHKQYRVANKERIKAHNLEQVICDVCGANASRHHLARHKRTNKCINHNK